MEKYEENINKLKRKIKEIQEEDRNNQELRYKKKIMEVEDLEKKILKVQNQEMELINNESLPKELLYDFSAVIVSLCNKYTVFTEKDRKLYFTIFLLITRLVLYVNYYREKIF